VPIRSRFAPFLVPRAGLAMRSPTIDDLLLLPEGEAVQTHFDLRNYAVFRRLLAAFAVWAFGSVIAGIVERDPLLLATAASNLVAALAVFALRENPLFLRWFRHILLLYLVLQLFFLLLPIDSMQTSLVLAGFVFPLLLLLLRLRISEYLLLLGAFLAVTVALLFQQAVASGKPVFNETFAGSASNAGVVLLVAAGITGRQRRRFLADWRRESARQRERLRLREEVEYARRIQVGMLPQAPPRIGWVEISAVSLPATEVGGDYYDYFELAPDRLALVVGDVAGHGLASGLLLSGVRSCLYLLEEDLSDPVPVLQRLHRMVKRTTDRRTFVTLLCAVLDRTAGTLTVASAGHPPLLHLRCDGGLDEVGEGAPPLGTGLPGNYVQVVRPLAAGDLLVLSTDGLMEAADPFGRPYGEERVCRVVERAARGQASSRAVRDAILEDLSRFKGGSEQLDDLTIVVVRIR
jgi:serine phosphatase RsbU (regulator of sigma subunit)